DKERRNGSRGSRFFLLKGLPSPKLMVHCGATCKQKPALIFIKVGDVAKTARINLRKITHK
ncbi:hypothetical protein, partial [Enterobacter asburiae]